MSDTFITYWPEYLSIVLLILLLYVVTKYLLKLCKNKKQSPKTKGTSTEDTKNTIPISVIKAASARASLGPGKIVLIGRYKGFKVYSYYFEEPLVIGLPEFYIAVGPFVRVVKGIKAEGVLRRIKQETIIKHVL